MKFYTHAKLDYSQSVRFKFPTQLKRYWFCVTLFEIIHFEIKFMITVFENKFPSKKNFQESGRIPYSRLMTVSPFVSLC